MPGHPEKPKGVFVATRRRAAKGTRPKVRRTLGTCLVLMPFKEPFDSYYLSIIKPAVTAARLRPVRGDSLFRPSPIMSDIWQMVQEAKVVVADLTEKNANVFYELGLAHAIGKPVVLVAETLADVPFDLQSLRVLVYDKNDPAWGADLRSGIRASLGETLSDTASAIPTMFRKPVKSQAPAEAKADVRLEVLERQVAALAAQRRSFGDTLRSTQELHRQLKRATSRSEAIDLVRAALFSGMRPVVISRVVRRAMPLRQEARWILDAVGVRSGA